MNQTISTPRWINHNGIIYFSVTSDGTTGLGWVNRLKEKGIICARDFTEPMLLSKEFEPTSGITYSVAILTYECFGNWDDDEMWKNRSIVKRAIVKHYGLVAPAAEVACLVRERFSDKEIWEGMGIDTLSVEHKPILNLEGSGRIFQIHTYPHPGRPAELCVDCPDVDPFERMANLYVLPQQVKQP